MGATPASTREPTPAPAPACARDPQDDIRHGQPWMQASRVVWNLCHCFLSCYVVFFRTTASHRLADSDCHSLVVLLAACGSMLWRRRRLVSTRVQGMASLIGAQVGFSSPARSRQGCCAVF